MHLVLTNIEVMELIITETKPIIIIRHMRINFIIVRGGVPQKYSKEICI